MKHEIALLLSLTMIPLSTNGLCQDPTSAKLQPRGAKLLGATVIPFHLRSTDLVLKLTDSISSASASGRVSSFIYAQVIDTVYDASGNAVIPSGRLIKLRYTVTPGKSFHRRRGELLFRLEPVEIEFGGRSDPKGWTIGLWQIRLSGTLHAVTVRGSGIPMETDAREGELKARRSTSPSSQGPPPIGTALDVIDVMPGGSLIHGLTSAGEGMGRLLFGKTEVHLPEGSTLHFRLSETADALYLGRSSTARVL